MKRMGALRTITAVPISTMQSEWLFTANWRICLSELSLQSMSSANSSFFSCFLPSLCLYTTEYGSVLKISVKKSPLIKKQIWRALTRNSAFNYHCRKLGGMNRNFFCVNLWISDRAISWLLDKLNGFFGYIGTYFRISVNKYQLLRVI